MIQANSLLLNFQMKSPCYLVTLSLESSDFQTFLKQYVILVPFGALILSDLVLASSSLYRQGPLVLAVGAGGSCLDIFTLLYLFSSLSPSLWETARYRLKYCLKGPLNPKQPTNQLHCTNLPQTKVIR